MQHQRLRKTNSSKKNKLQKTEFNNKQKICTTLEFLPHTHTQSLDKEKKQFS